MSPEARRAATEIPASIRRGLWLLRGAFAVVLLGLAAVHVSQIVTFSQYYRRVGGAVAGAVLFSALAALLFASWPWVRVVSAWLGVLLALQCLLTPLVRDPDLIVLAPNLSETIDVQGDGMPGIQGVQRITTDARGFRTADSVDYEQPAPGLRIFTIGASTTEEIHHDDRHTWSHLLGEHLERDLGRDVQVVNTGVSGTRSPHHAATLAYVLPFHPDAVVFLMGINDWNEHIRRLALLGSELEPVGPGLLELHRRLRAFTLGESLLAISLDRLRSLRLGDVAEASRPRIERGEYYTRQNRSLERARRIRLRPQQVDPIFALSLERIAQLCREAAVRCVFVTQPHGYRQEATAELRARFWMTPPNVDYTLDLESLEYIANLYNQYLERVGAEHGIPVCDVAAGIEPSFRHLYDEVHLNLEGSRRFAELLAPCVREVLAVSVAHEEDGP